MFIIDIIIRLLFREAMKAMEASAERRRAGTAFETPVSATSPFPVAPSRSMAAELSKRLHHAETLAARSQAQVSEIPALGVLSGQLNALDREIAALKATLTEDLAPHEVSRARATVDRVTERGGQLSRIISQRRDAKTAGLLAGADEVASRLWQDLRDVARRTGIEVPDRRRVVILGDGVGPSTDTAALPEDALHRPFRWAGLIPDTWSAFLDIHPDLGIEAGERLEERAAHARDEGESVTWQILSTWTRTLLLDTISTVALGGGHGAALAHEAGEDTAALKATIWVDHAGTVSGKPPLLVRLLLCRDVLQASGLTATAMELQRTSIAHDPPITTLQVRGPGILDHIPLGLFDRALSEVASSFLQDPFSSLGDRSLEAALGFDPSTQQEEANDLLGNLQSASSLRAPRPLALLTALARLAEPCPPPHLEAATAALTSFVPLAARTERGPKRAPNSDSEARKGRLGARKTLREAIRLGTALDGPVGLR